MILKFKNELVFVAYWRSHGRILLENYLLFNVLVGHNFVSDSCKLKPMKT